MKVGDRIPIATGSFQSGVGVGAAGTGGLVNPLDATPDSSPTRSDNRGGFSKPPLTQRSNLNANSFYLHDSYCDIATGKNLYFRASNTTPVRLSSEGFVFIKKWEPTGSLSLLFRYGENSRDSMQAEPHFSTSCHYQIYF